MQYLFHIYIIRLCLKCVLVIILHANELFENVLSLREVANQSRQEHLAIRTHIYINSRFIGSWCRHLRYASVVRRPFRPPLSSVQRSAPPAAPTYQPEGVKAVEASDIGKSVTRRAHIVGKCLPAVTVCRTTCMGVRTQIRCHQTDTHLSKRRRRFTFHDFGYFSSPVLLGTPAPPIVGAKWSVRWCNKARNRLQRNF